MEKKQRDTANTKQITVGGAGAGRVEIVIAPSLTSKLARLVIGLSLFSAGYALVTYRWALDLRLSDPVHWALFGLGICFILAGGLLYVSGVRRMVMSERKRRAMAPLNESEIELLNEIRARVSRRLKEEQTAGLHA